MSPTDDLIAELLAASAPEWKQALLSAIAKPQIALQLRQLYDTNPIIRTSMDCYLKAHKAIVCAPLRRQELDRLASRELYRIFDSMSKQMRTYASKRDGPAWVLATIGVWCELRELFDEAEDRCAYLTALVSADQALECAVSTMIRSVCALLRSEGLVVGAG